MDNLKSSEHAEQFLKGIGVQVSENIVRKVVLTLMGESETTLYRLYTGWKGAQGKSIPPFCGKGTAYKIKQLYDEGRLGPYVGFIRSSSESVDDRPVRGDDESHGEDTSERATHLIVSAETSLDGRDPFGHSGSSVSYPIDVFFSVTNRGRRVLKYLQFHVWFIRPYVYWDPEIPDIRPWVDEGPDALPAELPGFAPQTEFHRQVVRLSPSQGFFLMPSDHRHELAPMRIRTRGFPQTMPIPWKLEAFGAAPLKGLLVLRRDGQVLRSEVVKPKASAHT